MPCAREIAAVVFDPPPLGPVVHNAPKSSVRNQEYDMILGNTLRAFSHQDVELFRAWLELIPFNFNEITQPTTGRVFESEVMSVSSSNRQ